MAKSTAGFSKNPTILFHHVSPRRRFHRSIRLLSGHALTCQSPAKLALADTYKCTKTGACSQHRTGSKQLHVCRLGIVFQRMKRNQPEVRSRQTENPVWPSVTPAPVAVRISTMLSIRNYGAISVRGKVIHPKPCQILWEDWWSVLDRCGRGF
jgi:hypothetical protein